MVHFIKEISNNQIDQLNFEPKFNSELLWWFKKKRFLKNPAKKWTWFKKNPTKLWLVTLEKEDFELNLHIYQEGWRKQFPDGETLLSECAKRLYEKGKFRFKNNFDIDQALENYWIVLGRTKKGPFMLFDGNNRAISHYINTFIEKVNDFKPVTRVLCCISEEKGWRIFDLLDKLKV